jgi:arsenite oxidase small subunit
VSSPAKVDGIDATTTEVLVRMKRRKFVKICASAVVGVSASPEILARGDREYHPYNRVKLIGHKTLEPITTASLEVGTTYLFHYPFVTTPCFLIDLGKPVMRGENLKTREGNHYRWNGGVGPKRSIVAFSAICTHRMSHPARSVSFINYRHGKASFKNHQNEIVEQQQVIYCCSEKSVYNPARGGMVLGGPAPQPLAAIALDYDQNSDQIYATATMGGEMFNQYFAAFGQRLVLDHGRTDIRNAAIDTTSLLTLDEYCANQIVCDAEGASEA